MVNHEYPLTPEQERLWIEWKLHPLSCAYNNHLVLKLIGELDVDRLILSVKKSACDDIFRIKFFEKFDRPFQKLLEKKDINFNYIELPTLESVNSYIQNSIQIPFNLKELFAYRFFLIKSSSEGCYYLVFIMHHILNDGNFNSVFFDRVSRYYADIEHQLTDTATFEDYLKEQSFLTNRNLDNDLLYWKEKLNSYLPTMEIFNNRPLTERADGQFEYIIRANLVNNLKKIAFQNKSTLFLCLMSALKILVYRYFNYKELVFLYTTNNRPLFYKRTLGFFVSTFPMVSQFQPQETFLEFLKKITSQRKNDKKHQNISLLDIFNAMRDSSRTIESNNFVTFSKTSFFPKKFILKNVDIKIISLKYVKEFFGNLSFLYDEDDNNNLHFVIHYNKNIFENWFVKQFMSHFEKLLNEISKNSLFVEYSSASFMDFKEVIQKNRKVIFRPNNHTFIHKRIEEHAAISPQKIAIISEEKTITYKELNIRANQLAKFLSKQGVKSGDFVCLMVDRNAVTIIAILAILKLGAVYIPIDVKYPETRINYILNDCNCKYFLINESKFKNLNKIDQITIFDLSEICFDIKDDLSSNFQSKISLDNIMYIIYTSGTTGFPKGIPITHKNIISLFAVSSKIFNFNADDVWTLFHSLAFDFSVWEWCGALNYGGSLVVVPYDVSRSSEKFYEFVHYHKITVLNKTPSAFYQFIESDNILQKNNYLRYIILGGEKLEYKFLDDWLSRHGDMSPELFNMYGITEGTIHVTLHKIYKKLQNNIMDSVIGKPLLHMQAYVLHDRCRLAPFGCPGELHITGLGLTAGYLNKSSENIERFVNNPFSSDKSTDRLYATGDIVKKLPNGELIYLGRYDTQVNFKGFRIELTEIEYYLDLNSKITRSVVILKDIDKKKPEMVAFVLINEGVKISPFELRQYLLEFLPIHMIPSRFFKVKSIPLTINGKVNYDYLSNMMTDELLNFYENEHNASSIELLISEIWQKILGVKAIDMNKNFFDIGGDSVLLLKLHNELEKTLKISFSPVLLFSYPTILSLSQYFCNNIFLENNKKNYSEDRLRAQKRLSVVNKRKHY